MKNIVQVFRQHLGKATWGAANLTECLSDIEDFVYKVPMIEKPIHDATLQVYVEDINASKEEKLKQANTTSCFLAKSSGGKALLHAQREKNCKTELVTEIPLQLWSSVFPWEIARGLSGVPEKDLLDTKCLKGSGREAVRGMLFVEQQLKIDGPSCYWSGGITTPIDVAFLIQSGLRERPKWERPKTVMGRNNILDCNDILKQPAIMQSVHQLDPLPKQLDAIKAEELMIECNCGKHERLGKYFGCLSSHSAIEYALETPHGFLMDTAVNVQRGVMKEKNLSHPPRVQFSVMLSTDLQKEIQEKNRMDTDFILRLESRLQHLFYNSDRIKSRQENMDNKTRAERDPIDFRLFALCLKMQIGLEPLEKYVLPRVIGELSTVSDEDFAHCLAICKDGSQSLFPSNFAQCVRVVAEKRGVW